MRVFLIGLMMLSACATASTEPVEAVDFDTYVAELAANHEHGETHNYTPLDERVDLLKRGELVSFCAEVAQPGVELLVDAGFDARRIVYIALTPDEDGIHQGHQVIEAWHPKRERWVIVDLDYGVLMDQTATSTRDGRVEREPLEPDARDTEWDGGYPLVAEGVGVVVDGVVRFDPDAYTAEQAAILAEHHWRPWKGDYATDFYSQIQPSAEAAANTDDRSVSAGKIAA